MSQRQPMKPAFGQSGPTRRRTLRLSQEELVKAGPLAPDANFPLLVEPEVESVNLIAWAAAQRHWIDSRLAEHGALLFRGFGIASAAELDDFIAATSGGSLRYTERSSPRSQVGGNVYTSTDYPPDQEIYLHNEQSYNLTFPRKIYFCCLTAAAQGGATPIADSRRVFERIDPEIRQRFLEQGYMYVRNFGDGFGLSWQTAFQTDEPSAVETYCRDNDIELEWKGDHRLRTRQVRPAVARHPGSGRLSWFNHATFFHISTLGPAVQEKLLEQFEAADLPNNTYYGDGSPIEPAVMASLHDAYDRERRRFPWQEGDVLMLDNMLVAHGREAFSGERKVVVGMADPQNWNDVMATDPQPGRQGGERGEGAPA